MHEQQSNAKGVQGLTVLDLMRNDMLVFNPEGSLKYFGVQF